MTTANFVDYTVHEYGRSPMPGVYLATRRKDGFLYTEIKSPTSHTRKFVNPKDISNRRVDIQTRFIDKPADL